MMSGTPRFSFLLTDRQYFESLDRYTPTRELFRVVDRELSSEWTHRRGGFWSRCSCDGVAALEHGWKIHISAIPDTAVDTLGRVVPLLARARTNFKDCADKRMLFISTSKTFPRTGAGKFITIYPTTVEEFLRLLADCAEATQDLDGPYILSDRRYPASKVVFYRYGEHRGRPYIDGHGFLRHAYIGPGGERVSDERVAVYRQPDWIQDPVPGAEALDATDVGEIALHDRFVMQRAERFSATGGLYIALDRQTNDSVVIREARPFLGSYGPRLDVRQLLAKEARILRRLSEAAIAPRCVDVFDAWEHTFLVQELIAGESLWAFMMGMLFNADAPDPQALLTLVADLMDKIATGLEAVHSRGIVLRDFTKGNVMVLPDRAVRFIDFEFAFELEGTDPPIAAWTVGYASPQQIRGDPPSIHEDYYAFGALLVDMLAFNASGLVLDRDATLRAFEYVSADLGLPPAVGEAARGLLALEVADRWTPRRAAAHVAAAAHLSSSRSAQSSEPRRQFVTTESGCGDLKEIRDGIASYIVAATTFDRTDRLWPPSADMFLTNPLSISWGACGVALALLRLQRKCDERVLDWIEDRLAERDLPPGRFIGRAGVALCLLESGRREAAERAFAASRSDPRLDEVPGLYDGLAGWGLTALDFWRRCGEARYLSDAENAGKRLLASARDADGALYWTDENETRLGLGYGASGIALFLTYLYAVTHDRAFLEGAFRAADFDRAQAVWIGDRAIWHPKTDPLPNSPKSPHMRYGSGGVGTAALRLYAVGGRDVDWEIAATCGRAVSSRITNKIWQDYGLAGYGEYLLDLYTFIGDERYLETASLIAYRLSQFAIRTPTGLAFPGIELLRISCDFGLGSAGIGIFIDRLLRPSTGRFLFPDSLLFAAVRPDVKAVMLARLGDAFAAEAAALQALGQPA